MASSCIGVLGLGALGKAVAAVTAASGARVLAWTRSDARADALPAGVERATSATEVVQASRLVFFAVPAPAVASLVDGVAEVARGDHFWVHGCKGCGVDGALVHEVFRSRSCVKQVGAVGGPLLASELAKRGPGGLVAASPFDCVLGALSRALGTGGQPLFRSHDLVGVELAGAMRNVITVAVSMADGMGESAQSALLARGLVETARLGKALGAEPATFVGIAGVGDLMARRQAASSRNAQLGQRCARGELPAVVLAEMGAVEGAISARALAQRAESLGVAMPLASGVARVLDGALPPREMIAAVLTSDPGLGARDSLV